MSTTTDTYRGVGIDCRRGRHEQCAAPRACRCDCHPLNNENDTPPAPYTCDTCGKTCQNSQGLAAHRRSHNTTSNARPTSIVDRLLDNEPDDDDEQTTTVAIPDDAPADLEQTFQRPTLVATTDNTWPHDAAKRYIDILIDIFDASSPGPARWEIADRIETILGLHERTT